MIIIDPMDFKDFTAGKDDSGRRIDKILRRFLSEESLSGLYKSLRKGLIKVNGKKCEGNFRVCEGDTISIADFLLGVEKISPQTTDDRSARSDDSGARHFPALHDLIIFKNEAILIINKPYDIPVQPSLSSKGRSLSQIVQADYEKNHKSTSLSFRTGPLHRLDRKTTGLLAFSQNLEGAKWFSQAIKKHSIQKIYLALLQGKVPENQIWEDYIVDSNEEAESMKQKADSNGGSSGRGANFGFHTVTIGNSEKGKLAHTEIFPLEYGTFDGKDVTLARILIKTGRTHQIRSQSASHGFPLLGDTAYGGEKIDSKKYGQDFFLHAEKLHFPSENPLNLPETISAPIPETFRLILEFCKIPHF